MLIVVFISNPFGSSGHYRRGESSKPIVSRLDSPEELYQAFMLVVIAGVAWYFVSKDGE